MLNTSTMRNTKHNYVHMWLQRKGVNNINHILTRSLLGISVSLILFLVPVIVLLSNAGDVYATASTYDVYPPNRDGDTVTGWTNLSRDCSGTYGCYNYIKIERSSWRGWLYVSGKWAPDNGWNPVSANLLSGCYDYRTTVDSYNDTLINVGLGVNIGAVGVNASNETIYRFQNTWSSGSHRYCK